MVITLDPTLESVLNALAEQQGVTAETLALKTLRERFLPPFAPRDDWERQLLALAIDCGVSPPHSAFSSDELYD